MKLLLTNDDGYGAEGLVALASALSPFHKVWIVAPHENRSGVSHGISLTRELTYRTEGAQEWTCSGLPADCVIAGALGFMDEPPDAVISGINRGANLGTDLVYSGTAAAAREASFMGIPGIAISLLADSEERWDYENLARFVRENLETLISLARPDVFVNVNAKTCPSYKGARITGISRRVYKNGVTIHPDGEDTYYGEFKGGRVHTTGTEDSDWHAVEEGYVSVSRVISQPCSSSDGLLGTPVFRV